MTAVITPLKATEPPPIPTRFGFAFSGDGRWAACLSAVEEDVTVERWDLAPAVPTRRVLNSADPGTPVDRRCGALPLDDGRVLLVRASTGDHGEPAGHGTVLAAEPADTGLRVTRSWHVPSMLTGFLVAGPERIVLLVAVEGDGHSRIWRLTEASPRPEPVLRIPGVLAGGIWMDGGRSLAFDHTEVGRRTNGILVDLAERSWRRVWSVSETTTDRIVAYSTRTGALAVTTTAPGVQQPGAEQIGLRLPGDGTVRFPETLNRSTRPRTPLTFDAGGHGLLVREIHGATARLAVYDPARDLLTPVQAPPGMLWPPVHWADDGRIHLRFAAPNRPPTLATLATVAEPGSPAPDVRYASGHRSEPGRWEDAELVELPGPAGPIETIVYGGADWRLCPRLVLALHGGPLAAWRFEFEPLFQHLAAAGIAVAAPNYRGSTGYGDGHLRPVIGDWGGPDLDDVVHLARAVAAERDRAGLPRPTVLGGSYGAFLALLAACREPELWSGCVALAPFTSASALHGAVPRHVGERVSRLSRCDAPGGRESGRDVLHECAALTAPLLLVHGSRDEVVPVGQSRALKRRLIELGRTEGVDFDYLEVDDDHHGVVQVWPPVLRKAVVRFCLTRNGPQPTTRKGGDKHERFRR
ncbi:alpha/beta fold hydrolase [Actinomadura spongiicola]|uniref:Alpha/beta fold hydrolase n=1 Tax=Actinomadura spongiicola TaxID=2303421 RepID=A0A372GBS3_9ACTN|nr:alpha/beta fold hydrolase [Actinomadura spongiicola]RFS82835.1 alpha/beta fold hydrolase [Actinomadura spongiicola]